VTTTKAALEILTITFGLAGRLSASWPLPPLLLLTLPAVVQAQFSYWDNSNGTCTITGYTGPGGDVSIPDAINGLTVTIIGLSAFADTSLTSVTIPASVTILGEQAFADCFGLTRVYLQGNPPGVAFQGVFDYFNPIGVPVYDPASVYYLAGTSGCGATYAGLPAFLWDPESQVAYLTTNGSTTVTGYLGPGGAVTIPSALNGLPVTGIANGALASCASLTSITVPNSVTNLADDAFASCASLTGVYFQGNAPSVGTDVFEGDNHATVYYLAGTSGWGPTFAGLPTMLNWAAQYNYTAMGGMVTIVGYNGPGGSVTIPGTIYGMPVTTVGDEAFYYCSNMTSVTIGGNVASIGDGAFSRCLSLTNAYFLGNAPAFGAGVFDYSRKGAAALWDPATIYYLPGTTGWSTNFAGLPTALWTPQVQTSDASFGVRNNQFGFTINWASGMPVVVEASTRLANPTWTPLATNTLASGSVYFNDPQWTNYPGRFYRLRWP
jgi:hypothetical protein